MRAVARAFAHNPVFANIVLVLIFLVGYAASHRMPRETFPDFETGKIRVTVVYPGADPTEIEEAISRKIETALDGLPGVKQLTTRSEEGFAMATVTVREDYDTRQILDHVRNRIEGIDTFPIDAETPVVANVIRRDLVLLVALSGDMPERRLKRWAEDVKDEMQRLPHVSQVRIAGARDFEISVEVTEERLQALGLTLADVSRAIGRSSLNLPAGTVRTEREEIRLRTLGRKYTGDQLKKIVVAARPNGDMITLDRIATIRDGFAGTEFTDGVIFEFVEGDVPTLDPGEYAVVVSDLDAFKTRYTNWASINIAGEYHGLFFIPDAALNNAGEDIALLDGQGSAILDFEYDDWYETTDGDGFSLTLIDPYADTNTWGESSSWRPSKYTGGTPGEGPASFLNPGDLVINEVLSHQDQDNPGDWVELYNPSTNIININGWYLSDDEDDLTKVQLSGLSTIAAGNYLVLTEFSHFGTNVVGTNGFAFSELGDEVYLSSGEGGVLTGYRVGEDFEAADRDVTFGRHVKSDGDADFPAMASTTYGASNAYPRVGPIVISEVHYHPADSNAYEFVELYNTASSNVVLYDAAIPTNTWQIEGAIEFNFPTGVTMAPGDYLIISETNATAFTNLYSVPAGTVVLGPYDGKLNNDGETVRLERPGEPEVLTGEVPEILVERVEYNDVSPWPTEADGGGASLERLDFALYANDVASWTTGTAPGPGAGIDSTADADGDGMPDDWEVTHFGGTNETDGAATDDWDGDGATNYDEWRAGTNPTNSASYFGFVSVDVGSDCVLSWWSETGKVYSLWVSTNLMSGAFTISDTPIAATPPMNTYTTIQSGAVCEWYRITVD